MGELVDVNRVSLENSRNPLLYPKSTNAFDVKVFRNPPAEYRGAPFWSWNNKLDKNKLIRQINDFEDMGMGGFHMHCRVGLDTEYLGEEFMDIVKAVVDGAEEKHMLAYLYDEDRWPSGFAGGFVLKDHPEFRTRHLLLTPYKYGEGPPLPKMGKRANAIPHRSEKGELLTCYDIRLDDDGKLASAKRLKEGDKGENVWYLYSEPNPPSEFFNDDTYVDTLSKAAMSRFVETTHEVFKSKLGNKFGSVVPSIFTDEPQFSPKTQLSNAAGKQDIFLPWTHDFPQSFKELYSYDFLDHVPEVVWDLPAATPSKARYHFHDHICERFVDAFMGTLSTWCRTNGIILTGHMMKEPYLSSQTQFLGEAMRCYRDMDMPGIDLLCDHREFTTAKQAQSVARQTGARGVMSEEYGVTGWSFTFEGHKGQGDWQAALGITLRVHHLAWVSMAGGAKRDYPAAIGYQSPWYKEYKFVEDHFARVNVALTRGKPLCRVAVIHPVESYWLCFGPYDQNGDEMEFREKAFLDLTDWLLYGHIDFDFVSESLFPGQTPEDSITNDKLQIGNCEYEVVIVPNLLTIRSTTLSRLQKFAAAGGFVIIAGSSPTLVDAVVPKSVPEIKGAKTVPWSKPLILRALQPFRDLSMIVNEPTMYQQKGKRTGSLIYQMRGDGQDRYAFICNTDRKDPCPAEVSFKGEWVVQVLDTQTGNDWEIKAEHRNGWTVFSYWFDGCASLLVRLSPGNSSPAAESQFVLKKNFVEVDEVKLNSVELSEPNVLLLDFAQYSLDGSEFSAAEEVLRIDNLVRTKLNLPPKSAAVSQPWTIPAAKRKPRGTLKLKFTFASEVDVVGDVKLALEDAKSVGISLDGKEVPSAVTGWWVDEDINTVKLPAKSISKGTHVLELSYPFHILTNLERVYVLGDFGVSVHGRTARIVPLELSKIEFGDYTHQGLPFYAGNVIYNCSFDSHGGGRTALQLTHFSAPVVSISVDGKPSSLVAYEPHIADLGDLSPGKHKLTITSFGNRENSFGPVHLASGKTDWYGPDVWRTDYDWWTSEYNLVKMGLLDAPRVKKLGKEEPAIPRRGYENK